LKGRWWKEFRTRSIQCLANALVRAFQCLWWKIEKFIFKKGNQLKLYQIRFIVQTFCIKNIIFWVDFIINSFSKWRKQLVNQFIFLHISSKFIQFVYLIFI
jgi:hypothetical protein